MSNPPQQPEGPRDDDARRGSAGPEGTGPESAGAAGSGSAGAEAAGTETPGAGSPATETGGAGVEEPRPAPRFGQYAPGPQTPEPGPHGQGPQYGQQPQYGQAPQYGQQPQYGQAPQYGQQPQYGQAPQYGQQPQYSQQQYGKAPYGSPAGGSFGYETPPPSAQQSAVTVAFWLIIATAIVEVLIGILGLAINSNNLAALQNMYSQEATGPALTPEKFRQFVLIFLWVIFAGAVINAIVLAVSAVFLRRGRRWSRILATVFLGLSILGFFGSGIFALLTIALAVASIVVLFRRPVSAFLDSQNQFKNPYSGPPRSLGNPYGR